MWNLPTNGKWHSPGFYHIVSVVATSARVRGYLALNYAIPKSALPLSICKAFTGEFLDGILDSKWFVRIFRRF